MRGPLTPTACTAGVRAGGSEDSSPGAGPLQGRARGEGERPARAGVRSPGVRYAWADRGSRAALGGPKGDESDPARSPMPRSLISSQASATSTAALFAGQKLVDQDMSGQDLTGADLRGADLSRAKLIGTNLLIKSHYHL